MGEGDGWAEEGAGRHCPAADPSSLTIERSLFEDGVGVVFAARDSASRSPALIKTLSLPARTEVAAAFTVDTATLQRVGGAFVDVIGAGDLDDGRPWIAFNRIDGEDLFEVVRSQGPLSPAEALQLLADVCPTLDALHREGLFLADLDPGALIVEQATGTVRILDLGFSRYRTPDAPRLGRRATAGAHTLAYVTPEHVHPQRFDARTDVFSLAVILFELVAGRRAFAAERVPDLLHDIAQGRPMNLRELRPELPRGFVERLERCLSQERDERPSSAFAFLDAFALWMRGPAQATRSATVRTVPSIPSASVSMLRSARA